MIEPFLYFFKIKQILLSTFKLIQWKFPYLLNEKRKARARAQNMYYICILPLGYVKLHNRFVCVLCKLNIDLLSPLKNENDITFYSLQNILGY